MINIEYQAHNAKFGAITGWILFGVIVVLLGFCISAATRFDSLFAWGVGLVYVSYDTWLLSYVAWKTRKLNKPVLPSQSSLADSDKHTPYAMGAHSSIGILVPAHNEREVIVATIEHLLKQGETPKQIIIINDGSTDNTLEQISAAYHFDKQKLSNSSQLLQSRVYPHLYLLDKCNSGKADSLNQALESLDCDVVVTVDADTLLEADAIRKIRQAFVELPKLTAACGILKPVTHGGLGARLFGVFQYFEYLRAFLSRAAWSQSNALLLVSGAFSAYRKDALIKVGGYDSSSLVEDYELIHRIHRYSCEHNLGWTVEVVEDAHATTDAPTTIAAFIHQRKRWFAGFLRTQFKYRFMIGKAKYKAVGCFMLPVKTIDTLQPIFGLVALYLLWLFIFTDTQIAGYALVVIGIKFVIDYCFHLWALRKYHHWLGQGVVPCRWWQATACCLADPLLFQPLRHLAALIGWSMVLKGNVRWEPIRISSNKQLLPRGE